MRGGMMTQPLLLSSLIRHAATYHGRTPVIGRDAEGRDHATDYAGIGRRSAQLAQGLMARGIVPGERVATLAWNGLQHLEMYFAISGIGAVCHTVNPRLFAEQIAYIINHAEDRIVIFDPGFADLIRDVQPNCPKVDAWIALAEAPGLDGIAKLGFYEAMLEGQPTTIDWPQFDELTASGLCYTSGTTGNPKGVLYDHRSAVLHAMSLVQPDSACIGARDCVAPASSMFHAMAWGMPYAATMVGAKLVLPGRRLDGASLYDLIETHGVTLSGGVPTIWLGVLDHLRLTGKRFTSLKRVMIAGSACPRAIMETLGEEYGVEVLHPWGMTETSPIVTVSGPTHARRDLQGAGFYDIRIKQGRPAFGCEVRILGDGGTEQPRDGKAFGDMLVRGLWICDGYYKAEGDPMVDGWLKTGDVATIDEEGFIHLVDRSKDVIKSGGEWISSIELENIAVGHPDVAEAAVIGVHHPKWDERPLLIIVPAQGAQPSREAILDYLKDKVVKWWLPDDVVSVDHLPHTATGKLLKTELRQRFKDHLAKA